MSRSYRKTPIIGVTTAPSEKQDKQAANRRLRRAVRIALHKNPHAEIVPHQREVSNVWWMAKDGKRPFDPRTAPHLLRK